MMTELVQAVLGAVTAFDHQPFFVGAIVGLALQVGFAVAEANVVFYLVDLLH
jgi:hypothetical protein